MKGVSLKAVQELLRTRLDGARGTVETLARSKLPWVLNGSPAPWRTVGS